LSGSSAAVTVIPTLQGRQSPRKRRGMGFRSEGFFVFRNGMTKDSLGELQRLSELHENQATPTIVGRSWGEYLLKDVPKLRTGDVVTPGLKREIEAVGFAKSWSVLAQDFKSPQLTYSFRTKALALALDQHTDGAPKGATCVAQQDFLLGVLLNDVPSTESGPYVYWPRSHLDAIDHLEKSQGSELLHRVRTIPPAAGPPSPFLGRAGDVIVAHSLLRHGTAWRTSSGVRRMAFFRLGHELLPVGARVCDTSFARS
jgi:hypothetical protein